MFQVTSVGGIGDGGFNYPSRARTIRQILTFIEDNNITNEMLIKVGLRINRNLLFGSNQRSVAMLVAFKSIMDDIQPLNNTSSNNNPTAASPASITTKSLSERPLSRLQILLKEAMDFLDFCRPLSISMTNAYNLIKQESLKLLQSVNPSSTANDEEENYEQQKRVLKEFIDRFIIEEIWSAQRAICHNISRNISSNDVVLIYGCSTIIQHVLLHAKTEGKTFKVIIVDSSPHFNGRRMLSFLNENYIDVSYTLINSISFVIRQATKVIIGANSILANGYVMSHIGTSQVALIAKANNVPTLVCCETYKLSDRVYVDSFGCNEVDGGHELDLSLNLRYDLTPPELVSIVITEKSTIPAKSVPALLRFRAEKTKS